VKLKIELKIKNIKEHPDARIRLENNTIVSYLDKRYLNWFSNAYIYVVNALYKQQIKPSFLLDITEKRCRVYISIIFFLKCNKNMEKLVKSVLKLLYKTIYINEKIIYKLNCEKYVGRNYNNTAYVKVEIER